MAKSEYEGIAFTSGIKDGWQVSVTERADSSAEAVANLEATIAVMVDDGYVPFVSYYNRSEAVVGAPKDVVSVVDTAKELGGIVAAVPTEQMIEHGFPKEPGYHGMQPQKLENINEGDSYDVVASTYSYDGGDWVNFYNGGDSLAGHYYNSEVGAKIFKSMFGWTPAIADKAVLPGGTKVLQIVGVKGKKSNDIYQNIKSVSDG